MGEDKVDCDDLHLKKLLDLRSQKLNLVQEEECLIDVIHNTYKNLIIEFRFL